jgi:hypothetical protein
LADYYSSPLGSLPWQDRVVWENKQYRHSWF